MANCLQLISVAFEHYVLRMWKIYGLYGPLGAGHASARLPGAILAEVSHA